MKRRQGPLGDTWHFDEVFIHDPRRADGDGQAHPDVTVVCGPLERDPDGRETVMNLKVMVEVLSPSTERYDRGEKFEHYKRIRSLEEYVLVWQDEARVELWRRDDGAWSRKLAGPGERISLSAIECELDVDDLYRGVLDDPS